MRDMGKWLKTFPAPEQRLAHYIRDLPVSTGSGYDGSPEKFFECTGWFRNVERVNLLGDGRWIPTFWRLPQSVTSLTINTDAAAFAQIQSMMMHLPNLDNLSLSGSLIPVDRRTLSGIGTTLSGGFGSQLRLLKGLVDKDIVKMLLEVPIGLHFTKIEVRGVSECLLPTVRLAEVCVETLFKFSYTVPFYCKSPFIWSSCSERAVGSSPFELPFLRAMLTWMSGSVGFRTFWHDHLLSSSRIVILLEGVRATLA